MFNVRLTYLRKEKKKTQKDMAEMLGITRPAYTAYETGKRQPDFEMLQKIADYFQVSTDYLLGRDEPMNMLDYYKNKIAKEFPDADLMFEDMESLSADQLEEVYKFIKYQMSKGDDE